MNIRSTYPPFPTRKSSDRLRDVCPEYRVATDALQLAAHLGCSDELFQALWGLCRREAEAHASKVGEEE